ncbi:hypothetical protein AB0H36_21365, partial [Kribbella sp. NPDC050820]
TSPARRCLYGPVTRWTTTEPARVDDGDLVTCGSGWFAGVDLACWLLERELNANPEVVALEQWIGRDRQGTVWRTARPPQSQPQHAGRGECSPTPRL